MREQIGQDVVAVLIPCAGGGLRVAADYHFECGIWRIAGEIFVGIDVDSAG